MSDTEATERNYLIYRKLFSTMAEIIRKETAKKGDRSTTRDEGREEGKMLTVSQMK